MPHKIGHVGRIDVVMRHVGVVQHSLSFAAWGGCGGVVVWWCGAGAAGGEVRHRDEPHRTPAGQFPLVTMPLVTTPVVAAPLVAMPPSYHDP